MALNNHHYIYGVSVSDIDQSIERSVYERMLKMNLGVAEQLKENVIIIHSYIISREKTYSISKGTLRRIYH